MWKIAIVDEQRQRSQLHCEIGVKMPKTPNCQTTVFATTGFVKFELFGS